jgi:hypothetical protein
LFLAPQSDLENKKKRRSKGLGQKRPNPGCFWFTEDFLGDARTSEWPVWAQNGKNGAHKADTLCLQ